MAGSGEKDAKAGPSEERTTERRVVAASSVMHPADSTRDVANEDFLFHLYRGSELLQDNRVLEAKEELEQALTLQPRDPKGQDLLADLFSRVSDPSGIYEHEWEAGDCAIWSNWSVFHRREPFDGSQRRVMRHLTVSEGGPRLDSA